LDDGTVVGVIGSTSNLLTVVELVVRDTVRCSGVLRIATNEAESARINGGRDQTK